MPQAAEDDVVDTSQVVDGEQQTEGQEQEGAEPEGTQIDGEQQAAQDDDEVVISLGEPPAEDDEAEVKTEAFVRLREANRAKEKALAQERQKVRELEAKLKAASKDETAEELGPKPRMADDGINFDEEIFEQRLTEWKAKKAAHEARAQEQQTAELKANEAYQEKLSAYNKAKAELKVKDFEDAEGQARDALSKTQQSILVKYAKNPATLVYALGKSPDEAKRVAAIHDPIEFALAVRELEGKVNVTPKKVAPPPERVVKGSGHVATGAAEKKLEQLRSAAAKSGDYTEVIKYRRQLKAASSA